MNPNSDTADPVPALRWVRGLITRVLCLGCLTLAIGGASAAEPVVSNVQVLHRPGTLAIEVSYDLALDDPWEWRLVLGASTNQGVGFVELNERVQGDVWPVQSGSGQRLVWNPPAGWLDLPATELRFQVKLVVVARPAGMALIKLGKFTSGSPVSEARREADEGPQTEVTLSRGFWLGNYEVTQREWEAVMGNNPSRFRGDPQLPVENVSWGEAMEYCRRVTKRERKAGRLPIGYEYRLPTEAEWEYACRAGTKTATTFGDQLDSRQANFNGLYPYNGSWNGPSVGRTVKVGSYSANAWGLHDMHGNVWEWCLDWYGNTLPGGSVTNPTGPMTGADRVVRGGSWIGHGWDCRSANRDRLSPSLRYDNLGFRAACAPVIR